MVAWMRWIIGMEKARIGNKGYLSMEGNYAQVQVQRGAQNPNSGQKPEKLRKEKAAKTRVSQTYPLRKISSSRSGCSGNHCKLTVLRKLTVPSISFMLHIVPTVASNMLLLRGFTPPGP